MAADHDAAAFRQFFRELDGLWNVAEIEKGGAVVAEFADGAGVVVHEIRAVVGAGEPDENVAWFRRNGVVSIIVRAAEIIGCGIAHGVCHDGGAQRT